ncbi:hypothetical protein Tco_1125501 [Tanacetum coccineum]|uniref:Uncharacterized protein n=1 Tax=Tanacetum coccineum TaxID=301880 RepID=A0ABQ5J961_9ASTR
MFEYSSSRPKRLLFSLLRINALKREFSFTIRPGLCTEMYISHFFIICFPLMNPQDSSLMKGFWMSSVDLQVDMFLSSSRSDFAACTSVALPFPLTSTTGSFLVVYGVGSRIATLSRLNFILINQFEGTLLLVNVIVPYTLEVTRMVDEGEPTGSTALEATIATGSGESVHGGRL